MESFHFTRANVYGYRYSKNNWLVAMYVCSLAVICSARTITSVCTNGLYVIYIEELDVYICEQIIY